MMNKKKLIENKDDLIYNLMRYRYDAGLSQQKVANMLNVERSTYTYYETGKTTPDIFTIIKLSKIFGITLKDILTIERRKYD